MGETTVVGDSSAAGQPGNTKGSTINTGALTANTPKSITHNLGLADYQLQVHNASNNQDVFTLKKDPADPTNKIIVEVGVDLAGGLDISIIGYN